MDQNKKFASGKNGRENFPKVSSRFLQNASSSFNKGESVSKASDVIFEQDFENTVRKSQGYRRRADEPYRNVTVSSRFINNASGSFNNYPKSEEPIVKFSPKFKKVFITTVVLFLGYNFIQSDSGKPLKNILQKVPQNFSAGLDLAKAKKAEIDIFSYAKLISINYRNTQKLPEDFSNYIRKVFKSDSKKDRTKDPWGNLYIFSVNEEEKTFSISSPGADRKNGTADDIKTETRYEVELNIGTE